VGIGVELAIAIAVAGFALELGGWWLVAWRGHDVWRVMPPVLGTMGVAALVARGPVAAEGVSVVAASCAGLASGLGLYVATRVFVSLAARWESFRSATASIYRDARSVSRSRALVLALVVMVPGEELFFRGLAQPRLAAVHALGSAAAAAVTWLAYTAVNLASRSLPIVAGAFVGGALWAALAWWSGGMLASVASHILWTGLMLALPPGAGREERSR
jgi:membrane protease YdiL (CAAX protease family)